jgi:succinyldiaminopimelate transaminase
MVTTNPILDQLGGNPLAAIQDLANDLRTSGAVFYDFAVGDPDEPTPPIVREGFLGAIDSCTGRPATRGSARFRSAVAEWLGRRHGVVVDPQTQVLPSAGSKEAIFQLPFAIIDRAADASVVWGAPGYPIYGRGALLAGADEDRVQLRPASGWLLDLASLGSARLDRARIAWINYPHNPTGATASLPYFEDQVRTARKHNVVLCSDEAYQDLWFDEPAPSVLEACQTGAQGVLAFISLSKRSGMTGYRAGAIVGDPELVDLLAQLRASSGTVPSSMVQAAAIAAFQDDEHSINRRCIFAAKRAALLEFLQEQGLETSGSQGTLYLWFRVPGGDDAGYATALLSVGIIATPGRAFGPEGTGWMRLALVPSLEQCERAAEAWRAAIDAGKIPT